MSNIRGSKIGAGTVQISKMKATVLTDNNAFGELRSEWGLAVYIEYRDKKILLDTGASTLYIENAAKLGIDLSNVDLAVLSHAHYDHANGIPAFLDINKKAPFYISSACRENCYGDKGETDFDYIGIPKGTLNDYSDRLIKLFGKNRISDGITLLTHSTQGLDKIGEREKLYVKTEGCYAPDDFAHEQSLIFDTDDGLVVFNSCCHAGAATVINEVKEAFHGQRILSLIGGFHLYNRTEDEVRYFAADIKATGVKSIYTGHCTGPAAYEVLSAELGTIVNPLHCGLVMSW